MNKAMSLSFQLKTSKKNPSTGHAPIYARITINAVRTEFSIKRTVEPGKWLNKAGIVKGTNEEAKSINAHIVTVRTKLFQHYNQLLEAGKPATCETVKNTYFGITKKKNARDAVNKRGAAYHSLPVSEQPRPDYYGVCLAEAEELLKCGKTRASQLKNLAAKSGFIKVRHRFVQIALLQEGNKRIKGYVADSNHELSQRIRFKKKTVRGVKMVEVLVQTQDEIIPTLSFKTVVKFCNMRVSPLLIPKSSASPEQVDKTA